ncbi:hypothetical protein Nmel_011750 [Mimus melanotis]
MKYHYLNGPLASPEDTSSHRCHLRGPAPQTHPQGEEEEGEPEAQQQSEILQDSVTAETAAQNPILGERKIEKVGYPLLETMSIHYSYYL